MPEPIFTLRDVSKSWPVSSERVFLNRKQQQESTLALKEINVSIYPGEIFVIVGLSGSGKSTLLRTLNYLIPPSSGDVYFQGRNLALLSPAALIAHRRRHTAMVFQAFALFDEKNVLDNVAFGLEVAGEGKAQRRQKAMSMLEKVGLAHVASKYPGQLSGGMQQRVGLARALVIDPDVLLLDEAFSALDPIIRREMQTLLLALQADQKRTLVFVTHDMEEALRLGSRIAILEQGRLVQVGTPEALINTPATPYVRHFFSGVDTSRWQQAENFAGAWPTL